ncbi:MAG: DNA-directed RNA polymerase subunit alpha [Lentimicrobiaceae bacterium]|jgi:DNA-directed RNA polymerase subunit alpha|nr:DNA-directed RNA polymerase subunit alpha [Lentimicrobiaceae bacterium]
MAILAFQKPEKVIMVESGERKGVFEFRPLEPGFGITIGNSLRRILLSSLEGFAITSIRIEGVLHEFSSIEGVVEDVADIVLNLKKVRFKRQITSENTEKVTVVIGEQEQFKAGDINKFLSVFQVLNPDLVICNMDSSVKLTIELTINKGRGYVPAEENKIAGAPVDTIAIDSIHTPIRNVSFRREDYRVEQKTDYEKLIIEVETDGSIEPKEALKEAARILIMHFMLFSDEKITVNMEEKSATDEFDESSLHIRQLLKTRLLDLDLSVRALNCLKASDIETLGDLVAYNKNDLLKFRNFGKKSLTELEDLVKSKGLEFGMNISKYKLDKEIDK